MATIRRTLGHCAYRILVLLLLLGTAAGVAYNYYQASLERAAHGAALQRIERKLANDH